MKLNLRLSLIVLIIVVVIVVSVAVVLIVRMSGLTIGLNRDIMDYIGNWRATYSLAAQKLLAKNLITSSMYQKLGELLAARKPFALLRAFVPP